MPIMIVNENQSQIGHLGPLSINSNPQKMFKSRSPITDSTNNVKVVFSFLKYPVKNMHILFPNSYQVELQTIPV